MHTTQTWCMDSQLLYLTNHSHNQLQYLNQISGGKTSTWSWPVIGQPLSIQMDKHLKYRTRILLILHNKCWHLHWKQLTNAQQNPTNQSPRDAMTKMPHHSAKYLPRLNPMQQNSLRKCMAGKEETSIQDGRQGPHTNQQQQTKTIQFKQSISK